jgi:hypothetical protein
LYEFVEAAELLAPVLVAQPRQLLKRRWWTMICWTLGWRPEVGVNMKAK